MNATEYFVKKNQNPPGAYFAAFHGEDMIEFAEEYHALKSQENNPDKWPTITPPVLLGHICDIMEVDSEKAKTRGRLPKHVKVRAIFFYLGRTIWEFSTVELGLYANRDHSDVIHHTKKYINYLDSTKPWYDEDLDLEIRRIKARLHEILINCK
jgi:chromosomal replication initiation ATPase DnaA